MQSGNVASSNDCRQVARLHQAQAPACGGEQQPACEVDLHSPGALPGDGVLQRVVHALELFSR